jgi:hypothetical protein
LLNTQEKVTELSAELPEIAGFSRDGSLGAEVSLFLAYRYLTNKLWIQRDFHALIRLISAVPRLSKYVKEQLSRSSFSSRSLSFRRLSLAD